MSGWTAATYLAAASAAVGVVSAISQGQQASAAAKYNSKVAENNAIASRQQAEANAAAQQRKARITQGSMRAGYGASGVGLEGSPMDVLEQSAAMAELDRQNILYGGQIRAQGYESTAGLEMMRSDNAVTGSYFNAGSALLTGATKGGMFEDTSSSGSGGTFYGLSGTGGTGLRRTG